MDEASISRFIADTFEGVDAVVASGNTFFIYDPERSLPAERKFPFATLVTNDDYDSVSDLNRPGIFRLNIGVGRETYLSLFAAASDVAESDAAGHDFTALNRLLPHPVYAPQSWVCILNPDDATFRDLVAPLLTEAYQRVAGRHAKRTSQG